MDAITTQNQMVLDHLKTHHSITDAEAYEKYGIRRLSARIFDLKESGEHIMTKMESQKNRFGKTVRYARYVMV